MDPDTANETLQSHCTPDGEVRLAKPSIALADGDVSASRGHGTRNMDEKAGTVPVQQRQSQRVRGHRHGTPPRARRSQEEPGKGANACGGDAHRTAQPAPPPRCLVNRTVHESRQPRRPQSVAGWTDWPSLDVGRCPPDLPADLHLARQLGQGGPSVGGEWLNVSTTRVGTWCLGTMGTAGRDEGHGGWIWIAAAESPGCESRDSCFWVPLHCSG